MTAPTEPYLAVEMLGCFALEVQGDDGEWFNEAVCTADMFERPDGGSCLCSHFGSGLWIRCVERHADHFVHVDGAGESFRYRLVPLTTTRSN